MKLLFGLLFAANASRLAFGKFGLNFVVFIPQPFFKLIG